MELCPAWRPMLAGVRPTQPPPPRHPGSQVVHTLAFNTSGSVHDQLASSRALKHIERMLTKPAWAGLDIAAGQLLTDCAYLCQRSALGRAAAASLSGAKLAAAWRPSSAGGGARAAPQARTGRAAGQQLPCRPRLGDPPWPRRRRAPHPHAPRLRTRARSSMQQPATSPLPRPPHTHAVLALVVGRSGSVNTCKCWAAPPCAPQRFSWRTSEASACHASAWRAAWTSDTSTRTR
jgi:hypothetical protein